jgi:hypothetical protein
MAVGDVHTFRRANVWLNEIEGSSTLLLHAVKKKRDALAIGRRLAADRRVAQIVHEPDGKVSVRR